MSSGMTSEEFVRVYSRVLVNGGEFYNTASPLFSGVSWDRARLRWLVVFPCSSFSKDMSMTASVLLDWCHSCYPDVYFDVAYMPARCDVRWYDKESQPYGIGFRSHRDAGDFDLVGFSVSCLEEVPAVAWCMGSWGRCSRPVPTWWSDRRGEALGRHPIVYGGGASILHADLLAGGDGMGHVGLLDFVYVGEVWDESALFDGLLSGAFSGMTVDGVVESLRSRGLLCYYQPQRYVAEFSGNRLVSMECGASGDPGYVVPNTGHGRPSGLLGSAVGYVRASGGNAGLCQVVASEGCGFSGNCTFCHEGWVSGGLHGLSPREVYWQAVEGRARTGASTVKLASYNLNYVRSWKELVGACSREFRHVSFSNMRMEELGSDVGGLELCLAAGYRRVSAPIEGVSPRLRNGLYNKGLSQEALDSYVGFMLHRGCFDIKLGVVLSGFEEDSDWAWLCDWVSGWRRVSGVRGGCLPFRFQCTPLVVYPLTPLAGVRKAAAWLSWCGEFPIPRVWYRRLTEDLGVRVELNYYSGSVLHEQALVSLGRELLPLVWGSVCRGVMVYDLRSLTRDSAYDSGVRARIGSDEGGFFDAVPADELVTLVSAVRTPLDSHRRYQARHLWEEHERCLGGSGVLDRSRCMSGVHVRETGLLCTACSGYVGSGCSVEDSFADVLCRPARRDCAVGYVVRFQVVRCGDAELLNPRASLYIAASCILRGSSELAGSFLGVRDQTNLRGQSYVGSHWVVGGLLLLDMEFSGDVSVSGIEAGVQYMKAHGGGHVVRSYYRLDVSDVVHGTDVNLYRVSWGLSQDILEYCGAQYDGSVLVLEGDKLKPHGAGLRAPVFHGRSGGYVLGLMSTPVSYNPWYHLQAFLRPKRVHTHKLYRSVSLECLGVVRDGSTTVCSGCGRRVSLYDVGSSQGLPYCLGCLEDRFR